MADYAPRLTTPATFRALDAACGDSGSSSSAWLGRELAQRDRWLDAHQRRGFSEAWPAGQAGVTHFGAGVAGCGGLPVISGIGAGGNLLGLYDFEGTPRAHLHSGIWYLRANIAAGAEVVACPVTADRTGVISPDPQGRWRITLVGTGAVLTYAIPAPADEGARRIGLQLWADPAAAGGITQALRHARTHEVAGYADMYAAGVRVGWGIRIFDGGAPGRRFTDWAQIMGFVTTGYSPAGVVVPNDAVVTAEAVTTHGYDGAGYGLQWEAIGPVSCIVHGVAYYEVP